MNKKILSGLLCCLAAPGGAHEDIFSLSLEELSQVSVSIATGTPKSLASVPAGASVVTSEEIAAMGAQTLEEILETIPGVHVSRGSFQYAPRYFIRGIVSTYNPQTLMLVNGVPMTSLFLGDRGERIPNQYSLPVKTIERVEVIRGPGSALYGADAFAGVINVITKSADDIDGTQISSSWGSFDTGRASLLQSHKTGEFKSAISIGFATTKGDDNAIIESDFQSVLDPSLPTPVSFAPGAAQTSSQLYDLRFDTQWRDLQWRASWMRARDTGTGQGINDALDPDGRFIHTRGTTDLTWRNADWVDNWEFEAQLSYLYGAFENPGGTYLFPPGADFGNGVFPDGVIAHPALEEEHVRANISALWSGWESHRVRIGAGYHWGDVFETHDLTNYTSLALLAPRPNFVDVSDTPDVFQPEESRRSHYVFAQDEWQFAQRWELTTGVRFDEYSDVGDTVNPRMALVWATTNALTSKLIYGEAFRAPAFFELYATNNPVAQGNPDLVPESLKSLELAFDWRPDDEWTLALNLYDWRISDYIDFVADPGQSTYTAQNAGKIVGQGVETEVRQQVNARLQWLMNYSYQRTRDRDTEMPLGFAPSHEVYSRVTWEFAPRWLLTPQVTWVGERKRGAGDSRDPLEGYTSVDLTLRKRWHDGIELALIGSNIFNADIREPSRGPGPGAPTAPLQYDLPQQGRFLALEFSSPW
ncbi:MAG: TonB-dependent receptor [Alcanivoracaceae bacterium]|nr:TonB-dependent receptor [Alcanivoracaceae bacterium]